MLENFCSEFQYSQDIIFLTRIIYFLLFLSTTFQRFETNDLFITTLNDEHESIIILQNSLYYR